MHKGDTEKYSSTKCVRCSDKSIIFSQFISNLMNQNLTISWVKIQK